MRGLIYAAVVLTAGYLAGIRHSDWLTVVFAAGVFFGLLCLVQAIVLSRMVRPSEREGSETWELGSRHEVRLSVRNRSWLPCSRFTVRLTADRDWDKKAVPEPAAAEGAPFPERVRAAIRRRKAKRRALRLRDKKSLRAEGVAPPYGTDAFTMPADAPHCGRAFYTVSTLRVFDSCGLFSVKRRWQVPNVTASVCPPIVPAHFPAGLFAGDDGRLTGVSAGRAKGDEDFRDVREYRDGDPLRRIHWKRSAAREEWLLREFESGQEKGYRLMLDTTGLSGRDASGRDRFYAFAAAAAAGLLETNMNVEAVFAAPDETEEITPLTDEEDIRVMLYRMYGRGFADPVPEAFFETDDTFIMNGEGEVRLQGHIVCRIPEPKLAKSDDPEQETDS